jgi:N-methylhydantoinase A
MRIGVEIGGTFTDLVLVDDTGDLHTVKVPSTPGAPEVGALDAITQAAPTLERVGTIVHGSTIATNGVLERKGARVGLLVTQGFADLLELQRQDRTEVYSLKYTKPRSLVLRSDVRQIDERIRANGEVVKTPDRQQVLRAARELIDSGVTSIAVCLLHSYRFPAHEQFVHEAIRTAWPELPVTLSHEIAPEYREYERASTTVLSSYVMPIIDAYLSRFEGGLRSRGFRGDLHVMQSNGGSLPASLIRRQAVRTLLSGPAGGVTAARAVAADLELRDVITFDMGGTSTDVCLIHGGKADITSESEVDHLPIRVPMLDIISVGAGGGSIARVDAGGLLRVGPESAGAVPGPVCYGRGGVEPTVTDANLVLGLIRPDHFLGGRMALDVGSARKACADLGARLGLDATDAARAIVHVVNASMQGALRLVSTERGVDPRGFWLLCYGGAGGQHAAALAEDLGLKGVIVPRFPGLFSAYGLLIADLQRDWSASFPHSLSDYDAAELLEFVAALKQAARREFEAVGQKTGAIRFKVGLDMRYPGQAFEIEATVEDAELGSTDVIAARFQALHRQRYGHAAEHITPEIVTVRVTASISQDAPRRACLGPTASAPSARTRAPSVGARRAAAFVERDSVRPGEALAGPVVIEEHTSTVWVPAGWSVSPDEFGHLRMVRT